MIIGYIYYAVTYLTLVSTCGATFLLCLINLVMQLLKISFFSYHHY